MILTQNDTKCNKEPAEFYKELALVANIMPSWRYHHILVPGDKSDRVALTIMSELLSLHCITGETEFDNNYSYFRLKFSLSRTEVEVATLCLHNLGLVTRSFVPFQTGKPKGSNFSEELHLKLNLEGIFPIALKVTEEAGDEASDDDLQELYFEEEDEYFYPEVCLSSPLCFSEVHKELELAK